LARELAENLRKHWNIDFDDAGAIGRRYRRQDEIGTPFAITVDFDTLEEGEMLDEALGQLRSEHGLTVPVTRKGVISGLLTAENLNELHLLKSVSPIGSSYRHYTIRFSIKSNFHTRNAASHS
jgi:hypothetical protein